MNRSGDNDDEMQAVNPQVRFDGPWSARDRATIRRAIAQLGASCVTPSVSWDTPWLCVHTPLEDGRTFYFAHTWLPGCVVPASSVDSLAHKIGSHRTLTE
jgi:hypothetical protein